MCAPWVPVAMMAVSAVVSAASSFSQTKSDNSALEYNAAVNAQNAAQAREEGRYAQAQASRNANEERRKTAALMGTQRAKMGASGAVVDSGSFLDVLTGTKMEGERNAMNLLREGDMQAWRSEAKAREYLRQSDISLAQKKNPDTVLAGSLITGTAKVGETAYNAYGT